MIHNVYFAKNGVRFIRFLFLITPTSAVHEAMFASKAHVRSCLN